MTWALELLNIRKTFGALVALDEVTLRLRGGTVHALLGENGAGKSTLMNIAYGLLRPDSGEIRIGTNTNPESAQSEIRNPKSTSDSALSTQDSALSAQSAIGIRQSAMTSPRDALAAGIGMVHQHFMLAPAMTVLDNILLGDTRAGIWLDRRSAANRLKRLAGSLGLEVDPHARVESLSVGQQQRVEILKALWRQVRILILDEPTAVLSPMEADQLLQAIARLRDAGCAIVFISHKLREVRRIADRVTVLRRGRVVWDGNPAEVTDAELARHMVGREIGGIGRAAIDAEEKDEREGSGNKRSDKRGASSEKQLTTFNFQLLTPPSALSTQHSALPFLRLDHLHAAGLHDICLEISPGQILGIAGVDGNGQQELSEIVSGLRRPDSGRVFFGEMDATNRSLKARTRLGLAHVPNDRNREALVGTFSIAENLALKSHDRPPLSRFGFISWRRARQAANELLARFDIRAPGPDAPVSSLSGGNQQKVVLARELGVERDKGTRRQGDKERASDKASQSAIHNPQSAIGESAMGIRQSAIPLILAMNPARGLDLAATDFVYRQLLDRRAAGCAILLISSELDELLAVCDRIGVLFAGRLTMTGFPRASREQIGRLMAGLS